jgi:hypothetical protein
MRLATGVRKSLLTIVVLVGIARLTVVPSAQDGSARNSDAETIRRMLTRLHDNGEFTGTVLVARAGVPVFRDTIDVPRTQRVSWRRRPTSRHLRRRSPRWRS